MRKTAASTRLAVVWIALAAFVLPAPAADPCRACKSFFGFRYHCCYTNKIQCRLDPSADWGTCIGTPGSSCNCRLPDGTIWTQGEQEYYTGTAWCNPSSNPPENNPPGSNTCDMQAFADTSVSEPPPDLDPCDDAYVAQCTASGGLWYAADCWCDPSPLVLDLAGNGFALTDLEGGVRFDLNADGFSELIAWTRYGSDDAFLVLDRNGNGRIDNGTELFGNYTPQSPAEVPPNGFLALAEFDMPQNGGNLDGVISDADRVFKRLRIWQDKNHNGEADEGELGALADFGVVKIALRYEVSRFVDSHGNVFRFRSRLADERRSSTGRWVYDVFLRSAR